MKNKLLVCTFSGGRTSAFMGQFLNNYDKYKDYDKLFVFANTGKEKEETLQFIDRCDKEWNLGVVWLEAVVDPEKGKGTKHKIVNYKTASRNGEPFEDMLKKYPMPTAFASACTRELKQRPMDSYIKSLGYKEVYTAIGIRYDERHRKSIHAKETNTIYPLCDEIKVDSSFIRNWWDKQCFDLGLKDYEGNCDLCFKKSLRKRLTLIKENPSIANWWSNMEKKYGSEIVPRFDLRNNFSIDKLVELSKQPFKEVKDKHDINKQQVSLFDDLDMDIETDCFCKAT
mgnify:FL=1